MRRGLDSVGYGHGGGRRPQVPPSPQQRWVALLAAGPLVGGCATACGQAVRIRVLLWRECGVLYNRQYGCTGRHNWGCSCQKARFVSDHLDTARRHAWRQEGWPQLLRAAKRQQALLLLEEEARFAPWGSWRYPWARRGQQPAGKTSGQRQGSKVFGAMDYGSGRRFDPGMARRFTSDSYQAFWTRSMAQTTKHLCLSHDGARSQTSQAPQPCLAAHRERLTAYPLPSYAPDDKPMAYLWKKTKQRATHHQSCKACTSLTASVDQALASFATHPDTGCGLFGRYGEESGLKLKQAAELSKSKPEHL